MANALFTALAKAQAQFPTIVKNKKNYNKGEYADLTAILNAIKAPLLEHGIIVIQSPVTRYLDNSVFVVDIVTTIAHGESGETYEGVLSMPTKNDAQSIGSAITYGRRYALVSMLALSADDDDDGEEATKPAQPQRQQPQQRQAPPVTPVTPTNGKRNPVADMPERMAPSEIPMYNARNGVPTAAEAPAVDVAGWAANPDAVLINGYTFKNPAEAKGWGMAMGVFNDDKHADNAYNEVKREHSPKTPDEMWNAWINDVARRVNEKLAEPAAA